MTGGQRVEASQIRGEHDALAPRGALGAQAKVFAAGLCNLAAELTELRVGLDAGRLVAGRVLRLALPEKQTGAQGFEVFERLSAEGFALEGVFQKTEKGIVSLADTEDEECVLKLVERAVGRVVFEEMPVAEYVLVADVPRPEACGWPSQVYEVAVDERRAADLAAGVADG